MTVRELLHRIDSAEITEWHAFFALESTESVSGEGSAANKTNDAKVFRASLAHKVKRRKE